jgi:hypothetical protein
MVNVYLNSDELHQIIKTIDMRLENLDYEKDEWDKNKLEKTRLSLFKIMNKMKVKLSNT